MTTTARQRRRLPAEGEPRPHPAKFSPEVLDALDLFLAYLTPGGGLRILDPFAGVGRIHQLAGPDRISHYTIASELEFEWAVQGGPRSMVADALRLPLRDASVDCVITSPTYANRMADTYDGNGVCRKCHGHPADLTGAACDRCDGTGRDQSTRHTYRIYLGRPLSPQSSAGMAWGPKYRAFHEQAWAEAWRTLRPGCPFILNVSDHIRDKARVPVAKFHHDTLVGLGAEPVKALPIGTKRLGHGKNHAARVATEQLLAYRKAAA